MVHRRTSCIIVNSVIVNNQRRFILLAEVNESDVETITSGECECQYVPARYIP